MAKQRFTALTAFLLLSVLWLVVSCSSKKSTAPQRLTSLNWVETNVLYDTTIDKKDVSLLFVLVGWCGYCRKLKEETLTDPQVIQKLGESFNIVQIDADSYEEVAYKDTTVTCRYMAGTVYDVHVYPSFIVLDRRGEYLEKRSGFKEPDPFLDMLNEILETYSPTGRHSPLDQRRT